MEEAKKERTKEGEFLEKEGNKPERKVGGDFAGRKEATKKEGSQQGDSVRKKGRKETS